ncbi:low-density lipoprotein receptor class A domain-containing protein 1-like isoform X3 [Petaurus breviceps papuanus]|uniref:low-density lipoprotein receptor class A domain-containing protein 1-like isoform X3 n=1 Tax=Petaurus breviceps papuanus TaxID=3040969 RepID=UPI0036DE36A6
MPTHRVHPQAQAEEVTPFSVAEEKPVNLNHEKGTSYRQCQTASKQLGFLCDDLTTCLPPSLLCNRQLDCNHGEDESTAYCGQMPSSLPQNLLFQCPNQKSWTYIDKVCDLRNDCGDCSDESDLQCPTCSGWRCNTVFFADCDCIPKERCKDGIQDCADWSDENTCA